MTCSKTAFLIIKSFNEGFQHVSITRNHLQDIQSTVQSIRLNISHVMEDVKYRIELNFRQKEL